MRSVPPKRPDSIARTTRGSSSKNGAQNAYSRAPAALGRIASFPTRSKSATPPSSSSRRRTCWCTPGWVIG